MCLSACSEFWVLFVFGFAVWFLGCFGLVGCAKITDGQLDFACGLVISDWEKSELRSKVECEINGWEEICCKVQ